jgi:serine protease Do
MAEQNKKTPRRIVAMSFFLAMLVGLLAAQLALMLSYYFLPSVAPTPPLRSAGTSSAIRLVASACGAEALQDVVVKVRPSVVYITGTPTSARPSPTQSSNDRMGSGVIFDARGYILTNYHVIADETNLRVSIFSQRGTRYPAKVIIADSAMDLAVIKIDLPFPLPTAVLGNSEMVRLADEVVAVGCPFSLEQSVTHGIISDTERTLTIDGRVYENLFQTDAAINSGNSGGPLVNRAGEVIGINVAIYAPNAVYCGVGFAIPINRAKLMVMKTVYLDEPKQS